MLIISVSYMLTMSVPCMLTMLTVLVIRAPGLTPTYGDIAQSLWDAALAGATTFNGFALAKSAAYISRVNDAFVANVWVIPNLDIDTGVADGFDDSLGGWEERGAD